MNEQLPVVQFPFTQILVEHIITIAFTKASDRLLLGLVVILQRQQ